MTKVPLSVVILTLNEALLIERCIRCVDWADDIVVVDSGSQDDTRERAAALGARVFDVPWRGWVGQRQEGIARAKHDWVFILEADEVINEELALSIRKALSEVRSPDDGYTVIRLERFFGVLLPSPRNKKRQQNFIRIFNRCYSRYNPEQLIHEEVLYSGRSILLQPGFMVHCRGFTFQQQMHRFVDVAQTEAAQLDKEGVRASLFHIVVRPLLRFLWTYIRKGEWRLGGPGFVHAVMVATAECMRWTALWEKQKVSPDDAAPYQLSACSGSSPTRVPS
jgi:glycosyltransferase involved in cell wall biosynthesis